MAERASASVVICFFLIDKLDVWKMYEWRVNEIRQM
jgi:hypothetical protein